MPDVIASREARVASPERRPAPRDPELAEHERPPATQGSRPAPRDWLWLAAALGFTFLFVARNLVPLLAPGGAIQDDARQHVFWMLRFGDPELFRDDLIADYYQSTAPPGFAALYRVLSGAVDPILASKLLPPVLGAVTALFTFLVVRRLHPAPAAAFLATVLLSWYAWQHDDLASASPRAFLLPALAALLWALAAGRTVLGVGLAVLAALLYPSGGALAVAVGLALYPADYDGLFVRDPHPAVTAYLRAQPKDVLVAGVPIDADSVPALAGRRVLVAREYALSYHRGYYGQLRRRIVDLIDAYYADSPRRVADFAARYGVDVFLVNRAAFDRERYADAWAGEFEPFTSAISLKLKRQNQFALLELARRCAAVDDGAVAAVPTACMGP